MSASERPLIVVDGAEELITRVVGEVQAGGWTVVLRDYPEHRRTSFRRRIHTGNSDQ